MIERANFKLIANNKDITSKIAKNLIELCFYDKEASESDEISFTIFGLYKKPIFGDSLKLYLGYENSLYSCGSFCVNSVDIDYKENTTQIRATAVNFSASSTKENKRRVWENTSLFLIAKKISAENNLKLKTTSQDLSIASVLQDNVKDIEFLYNLCFEYGYLMAVKNETIIISTKDKLGDIVNNKEQTNNLPSFTLSLKELDSLNITYANRNSYTKVILQWQELESGTTKSISVGQANQSYIMKIAQPKTEAEAFKKAEAKLNELQKGGINGRCSLKGKNIIAGAKLSFKDIQDLSNIEFSIKEVTHTLNSNSYIIDIVFQG